SGPPFAATLLLYVIPIYSMTTTPVNLNLKAALLPGRLPPSPLCPVPNDANRLDIKLSRYRTGSIRTASAYRAALARPLSVRTRQITWGCHQHGRFLR